MTQEDQASALCCSKRILHYSSAKDSVTLIVFFFLHLICALRLLLGKTGLILFSITGNWQNSFWGSESNHRSGSPLRLSLGGCDEPHFGSLIPTETCCFIFFFTLTHSTITVYSNGWVLHSEFLWESFFHVTGNVVQVYNPGEGFFYSSCNGNITIFYNAVMKKFFFFPMHAVHCHTTPVIGHFLIYL